MKPSRILNSIALLILLSCCAGLAYAQSAERWFQVEVTVFSNESISDRERERWQAQRMQLAYPPDMIRLRQVTDLLFLEWFTPEPELEPETDIRSETETDTAGVDLARLRDTGPFPAGESSGFRFPDLQRDPFLALPASVSEFRQSNQVIEGAPQHRVLFHGLWRQPMGDAGAATPIHVAGGDRYGPLSELQGSVAVHFNQNRDRVVFRTNLWLLEPGGSQDSTTLWSAPPLPEEFQQVAATEIEPGISRIYPMQQQRELRSGEFHYLDHPAMGVVVLLTPYDPPPPFEYPELPF